ncbi:MAG: SDR family oxidoreductase [Caldilineaceae bacterium]|nr:SDR family oxidoreductase [Caldilineaceae bacterium]
MIDLLGITNKITLITGAGGPNMGRAAAHLFASYGATVLITDIDEAGLAETGHQVAEKGGAIYSYPANLLDEGSIAELVATIRKNHGTIHHLLNYAAAYEPRHGTTACTSQDWDRIVGVTLKGTWLATKHAMPLMQTNEPIGQKGWRGSVVTVASAVAYRGGGGFVAYTAAKAGILGLTRAMAVDGAPYAVRVNCISPGLTRTPATPLVEGSEDEKRIVDAIHLLPYMCEPEDQAQAALWLSSDAARTLTGTILNVDGGWTAK